MPAVAATGGVPARLGKYEILTPLATGGMARIYIARTTGIGSFERHVVLKLMMQERAHDITAVQMFLDEARLAAALNHQNVAQVFEVGQDQGIHYLAMEYVHGQDLRALLAKAGGQGTRVPIELALTVVSGAAAGLEHAHERRGPDGVPLGIVHRDVSPSNIMVGYDGAVKLLDFGIAKAAQRSVETQSGIIKGKFAYMAPEQCRGREVDRRSDVFSLGIILYEVSTQHRCFRADSDFDTMHRIVTGDVVRPSRLVHGYPQALEAIVMKALAVDAKQRYQSAGQLLEAIESFAASARLSLSTMALGRFMREMFGELPEPWLAQPRASDSVPPPHRESTISNTSAGERLRRPASDSLAPPTILDMPQGLRRDAEPPGAGLDDWSAESQPTLPPGHPGSASSASSAPSAPLRMPLPAPPRRTPPAGVRQTDSYPAYPDAPPSAAVPSPVAAPSSGPVARPTPTPTPRPTPPPGAAPASSLAPAAIPVSPPPGVPLAVAGAPASGPLRVPASGPIAVVPSQFPPGPGSASGSLSYPRYEPPASLDVKPSRRPLFIVLGLLVAAATVAIAMTIAGSGSRVEDPPAGATAAGGDEPTEEDPAPAPPPSPPSPPSTPSTPAAVVEPPGAPPDAAVAVVEVVEVPDAAPAAPVVEASIRIRVTTEPAGAQVQLAGKPLGITPLDLTRTRGQGMAYLTITKPRFKEVTREIDLAGDEFLAELVLEAEPPPAPRPVVKKDPPVPAVKKDPPAPAVKKCQPPHQQNPFEKCDGTMVKPGEKPCPVCKA